MPADLRFFGVFSTADNTRAGSGFFTGPEHAAAELVRRIAAVGSVLSAPDSQPHIQLFRVTGQSPWLAATAPDALPAYTVRLGSDGTPVISQTVRPKTRAALPNVPVISTDDDQIVISPSKLFPFRVLLRIWGDGTPLGELLSIDPVTLAPLGDRESGGSPYLRLYVDDALPYDASLPDDRSPAEPACGELSDTAEQGRDQHRREQRSSRMSATTPTEKTTVLAKVWAVALGLGVFTVLLLRVMTAAWPHSIEAGGDRRIADHHLRHRSRLGSQAAQAVADAAARHLASSSACSRRRILPLSTNLPLPAPGAGSPAPALPGEALTRWAVTTITALIALLSFAFSFGNVTSLALYLKVPIYLAWLVGPAVDLSVIGLLIGIRYLSLAGYTDEQLEKPRRLLIGCGLLTMALNTAESICTRHFGTAAFDAVAPALLLGWSENGPWLLRQIYVVRAQRSAPATGHEPATVASPTTDPVPAGSPVPVENGTLPTAEPATTDRERQPIDGDDPLLPRARELDIAHRRANGRPISRDALRAELRIARDRAGDLCQKLRAEAAAAAADVEAAGAAREREAILATA